MRGPTQRSLDHLRKLGYTCYVVEHYNAFAKVRRDLFGFIDIVAIHPEKRGVLGVQTTTGSNLAARETKAEALPTYQLWLDCGNAIEFHGWRKLVAKDGGKRKTWQPLIRRKESDITIFKRVETPKQVFLEGDDELDYLLS